VENIGQNLVQAGNSRDIPYTFQFEYAADEEGLRILEQAGYPPSAFVAFLQQLMDASVPLDLHRV
jgi:predicted Zn-dependent protease